MTIEIQPSTQGKNRFPTFSRLAGRCRRTLIAGSDFIGCEWRTMVKGAGLYLVLSVALAVVTRIMIVCQAPIALRTVLLCAIPLLPAFIVGYLQAGSRGYDRWLDCVGNALVPMLPIAGSSALVGTLIAGWALRVALTPNGIAPLDVYGAVLSVQALLGFGLALLACAALGGMVNKCLRSIADSVSF